jgi:hypothetical protein
MTLLKAPVYGFNEQQKYGKLGDIIWDGIRVYTAPSKDRTLAEILRPYKVRNSKGFTVKFDPEANPEAWIANLYRSYVSAELRVFRPVRSPAATGKE